MDNSHAQLISIVVPVFNEEECVEMLYQRISKTIESLGMEFELIYIDDHSEDSTPVKIRSLHENDRRVKIISFSRNFGHQVAITAGLRHAVGDCVVVMDGDLQDPPELIIDMVRRWCEGFAVVFAVHRQRQEIWIKNACYRLFYYLLYKTSQIRIPKDSGDFCLMDKRVVLQMRNLGEDRPFVRGLRAWVGFKQVGIEYNRPPRKIGKAKYSLVQLFALAFDGILSFSTIALKISTIFGFILSSLSFGYGIYIIISRLLIKMRLIVVSSFVPGWATLACAILFFMGIQFIFLGVIGEYVGRIFMEVKRRPLYVIEEKIGFDD